MNEYLRKWNDIISNCSFDNTYKMAWAKSIVELSLMKSYKIDVLNNFYFDFRQIAECCLKYYWNQTIFFNLIQGSNLKKPPEIVSYTKQLIENFYRKNRTSMC